VLELEGCSTRILVALLGYFFHFWLLRTGIRIETVLADWSEAESLSGFYASINAISE
jgi:hypothetical protein